MIRPHHGGVVRVSDVVVDDPCVVVDDHRVPDDEILLHDDGPRNGSSARVPDNRFPSARFSIAIVMNVRRLNATVLANDLNFLLAAKIVLGQLPRSVLALHFFDFDSSSHAQLFRALVASLLLDDCAFPNLVGW